jgi:hypothetical protein
MQRKFVDYINYEICPLPSSALPLVTGSPSPDPTWARISKKSDNFKFICSLKNINLFVAAG